MVEIGFGLLARKALRGGDFHSKDELRQAIEDFLPPGKTSSPLRMAQAGRERVVTA
jgi:hypothetical protein